MNKTNFTPGPWRVTEEIDGIYAGKSTVVFAGDKRVMSVGQTRLHHRECAEANARLTAAAPEMYEALELLDGLLSMYLAVGQSYGDINRQWQRNTGDTYYEPKTKDAIERTKLALAKARGEK